MSTEENKDFIRHYLAALSSIAKTPEFVDQYVDDQHLKEHIAMFEESFPRYELVPEDMVAEGDKVAVRATFKGTHRASFQGVPASGREVTVSLMLIYRIANGRIVEHWMNADSLSLLQQIGALPQPEPAAV